MELRASVKLIKFGYLICILLAAGWAGYLLKTQNRDDRLWTVLALPAVAMLILMARHLRRRMIKLTILNDRLRYESGFATKSTRTMELSKVQDVRVDQTLSQRMLNIGDLSLETAGETSRIVMASIDRPHQAADHILALSRAHSPGAPIPKGNQERID